MDAIYLAFPDFLDEAFFLKIGQDERQFCLGEVSPQHEGCLGDAILLADLLHHEALLLAQRLEHDSEAFLSFFLFALPARLLDSLEEDLLRPGEKDQIDAERDGEHSEDDA